MLRLLILLSVLLLVPLAAPAEAPVVLCPDASPEAFPTPLARVRLAGLPVEDEDFLTALRAHFTLLPGFDRVERVDDFFLSAWATGCSAAGGYDPRLRYEPSVSFPIRDPLLKRLWDECAAFLGALGLTPTPGAGYIAYMASDGPRPAPLAAPTPDCTCIRVLMPLLLDGLSTEYANQLVPRDTQPEGPRGVPHILDYPWAAFEFDPQGRLRHAALSPLRIAERTPLSGMPISREQAVESALAWWLGDAGTAPRLPDEAREVRVLWALPMWMPNWANECLPGWCVRLELYNREQGTFVAALDTCVDAVTGRVAQPGTD